MGSGKLCQRGSKLLTPCHLFLDGDVGGWKRVRYVLSMCTFIEQESIVANAASNKRKATLPIWGNFGYSETSHVNVDSFPHISHNRRKNSGDTVISEITSKLLLSI